MVGGAAPAPAGTLLNSSSGPSSRTMCTGCTGFEGSQPCVYTQPRFFRTFRTFRPGQKWPLFRLRARAHPRAPPLMPRSFQSERLLAVAILLVGTLAYGTVAWLPIEDLVGLCVADDAFYYLTIARNVARGLGATFDGTTPTNGFHPVYLLVLAGLFDILGTGQGELVLHLGLSVLAGATLVTGVLIHAIARRTLDPRVGLLALALWIGNPQVLLASLQGVEAPLATAALALALWLAVRAQARTAGAPRARDMAAIGAAFGWACLCRTDSVIFASVLTIALVVAIARRAGALAALTRGAALAGTAGVVIAPWLSWNLIRFGRISQDSARAISGLRHARWSAMNSPGELPMAVAGRIARRFADFGAQMGFGAAGVVVMAALFLAPFVFAWHTRRVRAPGLAVSGAWFPSTALALAAALTLTFYGGVFWFAQRWYYVGPLFATTLLAAFLVSRLGELSGRRPVTIAAAALALAGFVYTGATVRSLYPWQQVYLTVVGDLHKLPAGARVGSFNAGIYGFVLDRGVVNLDGVVNGRVYEAMRQHKLLAYMTGEARLTHVIDHVTTIRSYASFAEPAYANAFGRVASFRTGSTGGDLVLLSISPGPNGGTGTR